VVESVERPVGNARRLEIWIDQGASSALSRTTCGSGVAQRVCTS
jgi:hypothetical protein